MHPAPFSAVNPAPLHAVLPRTSAKPVYFALLGERGSDAGGVDELARSASRHFLADRLAAAAQLESDFPAHPRSLAAWLDAARRRVAAQYREYLDGRHGGAPRRFFRNRSHALHFLQAVAPTKLVDGAWLYGVLERWRDARLAPLIRIYLEELGEGVPQQHHVLLYGKLLAAHGCERWQQLPDAHFNQGAIQLALAHHAADLLPEVIGFNLGYEQLPLHLLVTAYELSELDIDPYYFTLHVTVDNASTGHARKSLACVLDAMPRIADASDFYRRVTTGFKLNDLGMGTVEAIESFDLDRELLAVFVDKAAFGAQLHSDYCRVAGRTVNDWLGSPGQLPEFLRSLERCGWVKRGQEPQQSRFWRLLQDERAPMHGVFNAYEQQLISDWIVNAPAAPAGSATAVSADAPAGADPASRPLRSTINRFRQPHAGAGGGSGAMGPPAAPLRRRAESVAETIRRHRSGAEFGDRSRVDADLRQLDERLAGVTEKSDAMAVLRGFMSPANHPTPPGLVATRIFAELFDAGA